MSDIPFPSELNESIKCDICPSITDRAKCKNDPACIWLKEYGEKKMENSCKNKCSARKTKGQCEQFYKTNRTQVSDTIYDFDGKDHKCKWYPSYFNADVGYGSKDGICRERHPPTCPSNIPPNTNIYCNYNYISKNEEQCLKLSNDECNTDNNCELYSYKNKYGSVPVVSQSIELQASSEFPNIVTS